MNTKYLCILFPILLSGCASLTQTHGASSQQSVAESSPNMLDGIERKKSADIDQRLKLIKDSRIEDVAQAIAEVDEWLYVAEDEKPAREKIENEIEKLRMRIVDEVTTLSKSALEAPNGQIATEKMSKINSLLSLYPAPKTDDKRAKLEHITTYILYTSRRVEDIRRLRYNEWAISQIKNGLASYRDQKKKFRMNKNDMVMGCSNSMNTINPAFLEPVAMDLYNYVYGLTRNAVADDDGFRIMLANEFAKHNTKRYTPSDF